MIINALFFNRKPESNKRICKNKILAQIYFLSSRIVGFRRNDAFSRLPFSTIRSPFFVHWLSFTICLFLILTGCENNIETIKNITNTKDLPQVSAEDMEILYSDSARVKMKIVAKQLDKYNSNEKDYIEFPKGIIVYQYDSALNIVSEISADYAIYRDKQKLWETRNDVVAKNLKKNEQLFTEELFWNQQKGTIYSTKFTKIINSDGVFCGDGGFTAKEDLSDWKLIGVKGTVNVKDQDSASQNP